ncbi:hypothetical protein R50072_07660 [Simiduia litorea]|uniref:hypothetical protein n=1 Tax=Simiduia litorea TaxID=1435348 RepID=UPI0036F43186
MFSRLFSSKKRPFVKNWNKKIPVEINFGAGVLSMQLPEGNVSDCPTFIADSNTSIYDRSKYQELDHLPDYENSHMPYIPLIRAQWGLTGVFWEKFKIGELLMSVIALRVDDLPTDKSCLNPQQFRRVLDRDMYFSFGPANVGSYPRKVPVDWKIREINGVSWAEYSVLNDIERFPDFFKESGQEDYTKIFSVPVDDQHFIRVEFIVSGFFPLSESESKFSEMISELLATLNLELTAPIALTSISDPREAFFWERHRLENQTGPSGYAERKIVSLGSLPPSY